jgi:HAD superfamily hydrolase (TIGR01490 family)
LRQNIYIQVGVNALQNHQKAGTEIVLVSGSSTEILAPLAKELGICHVLATRLEEVNGIYTGNILPPQTIGSGKKEVVCQFLVEQKGDSAECYAYGDHWSDIPMLEAVGHSCIVAGDKDLEEYARSHSWEVL